MIVYLIKSGILLLFFYGVYKLWLENEKMFSYNRAYLLGSLVFSLVIPLNLFLFQSKIPDVINAYNLDGIIIINKNKINPFIENYSLRDLISIIYIVVFIGLLVRFLKNLFSFYKEIVRNETLLINHQKIVLIQKNILPHSFWNSIFINKEDFENGRISSELIIHEKAHLQQKHTLDIIFIEVLQIIFWFNPVFVFYKKAIKLNHEFLADEEVNKQFDSISNYQQILLSFASNTNYVAIASNINYLITKKRFIMMTKKKSTRIMLLKSLVSLSFFVFLFFVFTTKITAQTGSSKLKDGFAIRYDTTSVKEPQFPGGIEEFYKFVGQNFKMSQEASKNKITAKIYMEFMVEKDGSLSEFKIVKDAGYGLGDEAIRVLKLSPKWISATQEGKPVRVMYSLPITIQADK
ncbi:M56 family metallopeptidase [Flavobacterium sp. W22_SRS_FK3]|uniref:M56 family metallopeptidase n=1 Tax=Flavobacterium sp. W22_SRS_FK3 TaxID=3240275 RepID=UPI003F92FB60